MVKWLFVENFLGNIYFIKKFNKNKKINQKLTFQYRYSTIIVPKIEITIKRKKNFKKSILK